RRNPAHTLVAGPEVDLTSLKGNTTQIRQACGTGPFPGTCQLVKVPKGLVIFKNVQQLPGSSRVSRTVWDIMKDNPGLRGKDITTPRQQLDQSTFGNNQPIVTMQFTDQGRKQFQQVTKDLATRGALRQQLQSFAIVLDGEIISNPTVDYKQYPQGIDGSNGAQ